MPLTRDEVVLAYRLLLGGEPESDAVVEGHRREHADLAGLRRSFMSSAEFRDQVGQPVAPLAASLPLEAPPLHVGPRPRRRPWTACCARWRRGGRRSANPRRTGLCSAVTSSAPSASPRPRKASTPRPRPTGPFCSASSPASGAPQEFATVVEYGCGVGRLTMQIAPLFRQVTGLDISASHLQLAEQRRQRLGLGNVAFRQVTAERLHPVPGFDLWFSRIVLQHNPPPVILHILDGMFRALAPGGLAIFQVPTYYMGYRFSLADYAADASAPALEMHMVPQRAVLELGHRHGCRLLDLREDTWVVAQRADCLSNNFVFQKG